MSGEWHKRMQEKFEHYGKVLDFEAETEVKIPKGKIDCVWESKKPVSEYFIVFEFETATTGSQIVENLVKALSLPPQMRPRFLIQIYRDELKDKNREYIENISSTLPITIKIIHNVGNDVEKASPAIIIELFNWIGEYAEIPKDFLTGLEKIMSKENIIRLFHYGELSRSHLEYLDKALRYSKNYLLWIKSIPTEKDKNKILNEFQSLSEYDVIILSDVSPKYSDLASLRNFLEDEVKRKGKLIILTGGYGLTKKYNLEFGEENLGGKVGKRFEEKGAVVKIAESKDNIGVGLKFKGFNYFRPTDPDEVVAFWDKDNLPALIVHKIGKGKVIIFTSDCSPAWGIPSIETEGFKEMWKQIIEKYYIAGARQSHTVWYFAYGSNMNQDDLDRWCREKRLPLIRFKSSRKAVLEDFKLVFNYYSFSRGCGVANIEHRPNEIVEGVLYEVMESDILLIDRKEGHPDYYTKIPVTVKLNDKIHVKNVITYTVREEKKSSSFIPPTRAYMEVIIDGAITHGLSEDWVKKLKVIPTRD